MTLLSDSRARGGMLILALAFIGGTGCVAIDAVNKNRYERQKRDAEADRAFFRDVLEYPHVDARGGWLIFKLPYLSDRCLRGR